MATAKKAKIVKEAKPVEVAPKGEAKLTAKQELFCQEYLIDLNATQAAIRAGYSENSAKEQGCENLTKPNIQERISELNQARQEATGINQKRVLEELAKVAFGDISNIFDESGALLNIHDIDPEVRGMIASVKSYEEKAVLGEETITQGTNREVKCWDKLKALEMLGRHVGLFEKDNEQQKSEVVVFQIPDNGRS